MNHKGKGFSIKEAVIILGIIVFRQHFLHYPFLRDNFIRNEYISER